MKFVVLDVETSGFGKTDRVLEIGLVVLDDLQIVEEFETTINPLRDISNSDIHGLDATALSLAPTFEEIEGRLSQYLDQGILVAHNLPFDKRMINQEYSRIKNDFDFGYGICTLKLTGMKLGQAASHFGVRLENAHSALDDARATAQIFTKLDIDPEDFRPAKIEYEVNFKSPKIMPRLNATKRPPAKVMMIDKFLSVHLGNIDEKKLYYFDVLSRALADLVLSEEENESLEFLIQELGLTKEDQNEVHKMFLDQVVAAAKRDGFISEYEKSVIKEISKTLGLNAEIEVATTEKIVPENQEGLRVCFTGSAKSDNGEEITRSDLEQIAVGRGLIPVDSVTKKNCDLLVAADVNSMSGKTKKARDYGVPVMSVSEFLKG